MASDAFKRFRERRQARRVARTHHHGGGSRTGGRMSPRATQAQAEGETFGRQGGWSANP